jgi:ribokinase
MNSPSIVVVGSVNTDMIVKTSALPAPGETVTGGRFTIAHGGKGANQAVAAARLGAKVSLIARVGNDLFGKQATENCRREGIATDCILCDSEEATGVALILVDDQGENLISVASGANHRLSPADIERHADRIRSAKVLMLQLEVPLETVCTAAEIAAKNEVCVILDPAPAAPMQAALLQNATYLTPNEAEALQLTGLECVNEQAALRLLEAGAKNVILTLGAQGAVCATQHRVYRVPAVPVTAVDTTAAGDAFNGGLGWALAEGFGLDRALTVAAHCGALAATRLGAQPSLPRRVDLDKSLEKHGVVLAADGTQNRN